MRNLTYNGWLAGACNPRRRERRSEMGGFKDFVMRGNVVDLAVGVIIGAAFGGVVGSVTKDVITPIIGMAGGQPDFSAIKIGPVLLGNLLNAVISFLITAFVVYVVIV